MPTIREKISEISNLPAPVTIRQALNSAQKSFEVDAKIYASASVHLSLNGSASIISKTVIATATVS